MRTDGNTIVDFLSFFLIQVSRSSQRFLIGLYDVTCDPNDSLTCVMPASVQLWPVQDV